MIFFFLCDNLLWTSTSHKHFIFVFSIIFLFNYNLLLNAMTHMNLYYFLSKLLFLYKGTTIVLCCFLRCRRPTSTLTSNNGVWLMGSLVSFSVCLLFIVLFCYFIFYSAAKSIHLLGSFAFPFCQHILQFFCYVPLYGYFLFAKCLWRWH